MGGRGWRIGGTLLVVVLAGALYAANAFACSCAAELAIKRLKRADAAVEVELLRVRDASVYVFRVIRVHKGPQRLRQAGRVKVRGGGLGNSCALPRKAGWKTGLFLDRGDGAQWRALLCDIVGRKKLRRAAARNKGSGSAAGAAGCAG